MFLNNVQTNFNVIQPLPRFYTIRFGCHMKMDDDTNADNHRQYTIHQTNSKIIQLAETSTDEDHRSSILLTGIRNRDWNSFDDLQDLNERNLPKIKYQLIPSTSNTMKAHSANDPMDNTRNQYEEYDLDEQDFQWLIAYNQFRIEKQLPELDENIFEYIMQLLEQQCVTAIRQKNYTDTIHCDACHRIDDVDDLIQCIQCKTIVHKKCYGLSGDEKEWICSSCQCASGQHRCCICDKNRGTLKVLQPSANQQWIHLSCAFWFPKIQFNQTMTPTLTDVLPTNGSCGICYKTTGVKINCSWKNCPNQFHAKCAIETGQDMFIAENDDKISVRLLALCQRHTEQLDPSEKRVRMNKFLETKQKRFEQFASYINLDTIRKQSLLLPDVLESIHAYWILKRQTNNGRPLIDIPDDIFYHGYDKNINLVEFARQYHYDQQNQNTDFIQDTSNMLQFLATNVILSSPAMNNVFVKFARRDRVFFTDYERNRFCLLDSDRKKRDGFLPYLSSVKGC